MQVFKLNPGSLGNMAVAAMTLLSRLPFSWRGISALVLGILLAKWFWILLAPQPLYSAVRPGSTAANEAGLLFGTVQSGDTVNQGVALPNVQLLGIFSANAGKPGFAVLKLSENRQVGVAEGEAEHAASERSRGANASLVRMIAFDAIRQTKRMTSPS